MRKGLKRNILQPLPDKFSQRQEDGVQISITHGNGKAKFLLGCDGCVEIDFHCPLHIIH